MVFPTEGEGWTVRLATPADSPTVLDIWGHEYGGPDPDATDWLEMASGDAPATCFVVEPSAAGGAAADPPPDEAAGVVGFAIVAVADRAFLRAYLPAATDASRFDDRAAVIHMLAVDRDWQSGGVAAGLVQACMDWGAARVDEMVVVLWRREGHHDTGDLARKCGFDLLETVEGYYSDRTGCADCGDDCDCPATIATRDLVAAETRTPPGG